MRFPALVSLFALVVITSCKNTDEKNGAPKTTRRDSINTIAPKRAVNPYAGVDVSPMDMSYFPTDYPKLVMTKSVSTAPLARVIYSRPHLEGRQLFHDVLKYGEIWRLGANEATELDLYKDATIQGRKIKAGRYVLYSIPAQDKWTIAINSNVDSWGLQADTSKDVARFEIPVKQTTNHLEYFTMVFEKTTGGAELLMAWDNVEARLPISF